MPIGPAIARTRTGPPPAPKPKHQSTVQIETLDAILSEGPAR